MTCFENDEVVIRDMIPSDAQTITDEEIKQGYIPDGSGAWYGASVCPQYVDCCNDDDLVLFFSKKLDIMK